MEIRRAELDDSNDIEELSKLAWIEGFRDFLTEEEIELARGEQFVDEEKLKEYIGNEDIVYLVVCVDGKAVGMTRLGWNDENRIEPGEKKAELRSMRVHPDFWREGIGSKLLEEGISRLPDRIEFLYVEAFAEDDRSTGFYRSKGFEEIRRETLKAEEVDVMTEDRKVLIMEKNL